jgi:hypothetical protein
MTIRIALALLVGGLTFVFALGVFGSFFGPPASETEFRRFPSWYGPLAYTFAGIVTAVPIHLIMRNSGGKTWHAPPAPPRRAATPRIPVKIQCSCGQRYSFDVEPVDGHTPAPVCCPTCGADGTDAANESIASSLGSSLQLHSAASANDALRISAAASAGSLSPRAGTLAPAAPRVQSQHPGRRASEKNGLFYRIESREDALKAIKDASAGFFALAGIQTIAALFLGPGILADAALWAVLAAMLRAWNSRVVAILLMMFSLAVSVITLLNVLGMTDQGGGNVFLVLLVMTASIRALQATFLLHGRCGFRSGAS